MSAETHARIRRVQKFSSIARWVCAGGLAFVATVYTWSLFKVFAAPVGGFAVYLGPVGFRGEQIDTFALKVWLTFLMCVGIYFTLSILWLLHGLFGNLARGEIYTQGNVQRLRRLGWLMLAGAAVQIVVPLITVMLLATRVLDWSQVTHSPFSYFSAGTVSTFVFAGIVVLVAWIMDVGLDVKDEAATLRREVELTV